MIWCDRYQEQVGRPEREHDLCPAGSHISVIGPTMVARIRIWHDARVANGECCAFGEGQDCCIEALLEGLPG
jgi:hypothetical protein